MERDEATRRTFVTGGIGAVTAGLLAGCGQTGGDDGTPTDDTTTTDRTTTTASGESESVETPYSVSIEPVGEVTFESVPETWVANNGSWADMGIALGLEPPKGVWLKNRYHTQYYDAVPGLSVDKSDMVSLYQEGGITDDVFYELDADVHVMDPNFLMNRFKGWNRDDVE